MLMHASLRPKHLKKGLKTNKFCKEIGYKDESGPCISKVVGALTLSITQRDELQFLAALNEFFSSDKAGSLVVSLDGKLLASMSRNGESSVETAAVPEEASGIELPHPHQFETIHNGLREVVIPLHVHKRELEAVRQNPQGEKL